MTNSCWSKPAFAGSRDDQGGHGHRLAGRHLRPDPGARAVGDRRPQGQLQLPRREHLPRRYQNVMNWRASLSYVTGAHSMKVGYQGGNQSRERVSQLIDAARLPLPEPAAEPVHLAAAGVADGRSHDAQRPFTPRTPGRVIVSRAGRAPLRSGVELQSGRRQRHEVTSRFNAAPITFERTAGSTRIGISRRASAPRTTCSATARRP